MKSDSALESLRGLNKAQLDNARIIVSEFMKAGLPAGVGLAAVTNAMAESGLNASAVGDGGNSVGLFQLNALGGARTFSGDRKDPRFNTQWIAEEYKRYRAKKGKIGNFVAAESLDEAYARGATVAEMAGLFAAIVERPRDQVGEASRRAVLTKTLFGAAADVPANLIDKAAPVGMLIGIGLTSVVVLGGIFLTLRYRMARARGV